MITSADKILDDIFSIINNLTSSDNSDDIIEKSLDVAADIVSADGYFFFNISSEKQMSLEKFRITSLQDRINYEDKALIFPSKTLSEIKNKALKSPSELSACNLEKFSSENIYTHKEIDTSAFAKIDELYNYSTSSVFSIPLVGSQKNLLGIVTFINAQDDKGKSICFTGKAQEIMTSICQLITLALENQQINLSNSQLLESFIDVIIRAINSKSPSTSNHCQRVPIIAKMLTSAAVEEQQGPLKDFEMTEKDWHALHVASYLHDCGKITTPEHIVEKATKLESINNRIHEIRNRFEILRRDAHIKYLQKRLANSDNKENLQAEFVAEVKELEDDFAFIAQCNTGDFPVSAQDKERLEKISAKTFTRYFNRMLGLSWAEKTAITNPEFYNHPAQENILQDRPDHLTDNYNFGELYNLKVEHGTINAEERKKINEHINVTIEMLRALPPSDEMRKIIEYAGCHHEWVNGQGYPNQLTGDQMSVPAKIMAIADVFEALSSRDRTYKAPKKLSEILQIMQEMKNIGHLDPDLYQIFITKQIYLEYAKQYIEPEQIDDVIPENYL